ncbi:MAG: hypothetical protein ACREHC_05985 [Candidatus Levyibacteriota bacterium]
MKKLLGTFITGAGYLAITATTFAQGFNGGGGGGGSSVDPCANGATTLRTLCNLKANNLGSIIGNAVTFILVIAAVISLFFLIFGGIRWITSGGDKAKVDSARQTITAAIVGLVIAFLSFFILNVVLQFFGLSLSNLVLPTISGAGAGR